VKFIRIGPVAACGVVSRLATFVVVVALPHTAFAQIADDSGDMRDRIAIQEKLLTRKIV
jgi:hypothetical protein